MSENVKTDTPGGGEAKSPRRSFFGQLVLAVGGGMMTGSLLPHLFGARPAGSDAKRPVSVAIHPMAVPRSKEGSDSHV